MNKLSIIGKAVLVIFIIVFLILPKDSYAQGVNAKLQETIYPSLNNITLDKGSLVTKYVTFYNNTLFPMAIKVYAQNFGTVGLNGNIAFFIDKSALSSSSWFSFKNLNYAIPPKSRINIPVYIKVPLNAIPGGHYVTVFFQSLSIERSNSNVGVIPRLGSLFFITINGNIFYNSRINNVSLESNIPHFSNFYFPLFNIPSINTRTVVQNLSNTYINEHAYLKVQSLSEDKVESFNLPQHLILQNEKRILNKNIGYNFNIGAYKISSTLLYGYNQRSKDITSIYVIPIYLIILLTLLLGFCILVVVKNKRLVVRYISSILKKTNYGIKKYKKIFS